MAVAHDAEPREQLARARESEAEALQRADAAGQAADATYERVQTLRMELEEVTGERDTARAELEDTFAALRAAEQRAVRAEATADTLATMVESPHDAVRGCGGVSAVYLIWTVCM